MPGSHAYINLWSIRGEIIISLLLFYHHLFFTLPEIKDSTIQRNFFFIFNTSSTIMFQVLFFFWLTRYVPASPAPPLAFADPSSVRETVDLITQAEKPLLIIGKGKFVRSSPLLSLCFVYNRKAHQFNLLGEEVKILVGCNDQIVL